MGEDTTLDLVRVRAPAGDVAAIAQRASMALRALDLEPPAVPRHAVLCVRALADPLPGAIDVRSPHAPRATAWEQAARAALAGAYRRAARPAVAPVAAAADPDLEAVVFADRAELLAALAHDEARGVLASRWWWRKIVRDSAPGAAARAWEREPMYIAAAMEILMKSGGAMPFVRALEPRAALRLLIAALHAHALPAAAEAIAERLAAAPSHEETIARAERRDAVLAIVPELTEVVGAAPEARAFLAVALLLRRAPVLLRQHELALVVADIAAMAAPRPTHESAPRIEPADATVATDRSAGVSPALAGRLARRPIAVGRDTQPVPPSRPHSNPSPIFVTDTDLPLRTAYGGVFFLINAAFAVGDYSDYTAPEQQDCGIDLWDYLALTGRAFLGEELEGDPLWPLLAALARRDPDTPPGAELDDRDEWIVATTARLRDHIVRVLALPDERDPVALLLRRAARVEQTPAHLDAYFSLDDHPIEVRLAGLDRDPRWIAAAGRHVAFHFD